MDILGGRGRLFPVLLVMPPFPPIIIFLQGWLVPSSLRHLDHILYLGMHEHGVLARRGNIQMGLLVYYLAFVWVMLLPCGERLTMTSTQS